jgi:uncharacterized cupredoxin-like copper-binding protein
MTHVSPRRILLGLAMTAAVAVLALVVILRSTSTADAASGVSVRLRSFNVRATPSSTEHGRVTFRVRNTAGMEHELVVIKTSRRADALPLRHGRASERGRKGKVVVDADGSGRLTLDLARGHYVLICNIDGHYRAGMRTDFTVR